MKIEITEEMVSNWVDTHKERSKVTMKAVKKPVPVEVWQITKYDSNAMDNYPDWVNELYARADIINSYDELGNLIYVDLFTLEGTMTGHLDDYLVKGNHDDVWIVKKEIFEDTYEVVGN